jgi:threonine dehydrogenase-like Zn-dependent dehydrogenase
MIANREIDVRPMISHQFPISEVAQAFELAESYSGGVVKVILKFGNEW